MPRPTNTAQRLWSLVEKLGENECWPWKGRRNEQGYGRFEISGRNYYAHRAIYHIEHPLEVSLEAPKDRYAYGFLRHSCDNPSCCNPAHLSAGTHAENMQDKVERGRSDIWKSGSVNTPRAKLTAEDVQWIRIQKDYATKKELALLYEVSECTIKSVLSGRHYKDV